MTQPTPITPEAPAAKPLACLCGHEARIITGASEPSCIDCGECGRSGPIAPTLAEAVASWNQVILAVAEAEADLAYRDARFARQDHERKHHVIPRVQECPELERLFCAESEAKAELDKASKAYRLARPSPVKDGAR